MLAFFTALFGAIGSFKAVESLMNTVTQAWTSYQKDQEIKAIDIAKNESSNAQTSEDIKKAAEDAAKATRNL